MGPAHASVVNQTSGKLCVITFNKTDLLFHFYTKLYIVEPNETVVAEATPDPVGLYVAIVYKASDGFLHFKRWACQNESALVVNAMAKYDIDVAPSATIELKGVGKVRERSPDTLREVAAALAFTPVTSKASTTTSKASTATSKQSTPASKPPKTLPSASSPEDSLAEDFLAASGKPKSKRNTLDKVSESISKIERKQEESVGRKAEKALLESLQKAKAKGAQGAGRGGRDDAGESGNGRIQESGNGRVVAEDLLSSASKEEAPKGKVFMRKATQLLKRAALALGPAHGFVENRTSHMVCVITFNKSDLLLTQYSNMYILDPAERVKVEAIPDPIGLFVAIVFKAEDNLLHYKRWLCRNEGELIVHSVVNMYEIRVSGTGVDLKGVGRIRENDAVPYKLALDALADVATTTASMQEAIRPADEPHSFLPSLSQVSDDEDEEARAAQRAARRRQAAGDAEQAFSAAMFAVAGSSSSKGAGRGGRKAVPPPTPPPPHPVYGSDEDEEEEEEEEEEEVGKGRGEGRGKGEGEGRQGVSKNEVLQRKAEDDDSDDDDDEDDDEDEESEDSEPGKGKGKGAPVVEHSRCGVGAGCSIM